MGSGEHCMNGQGAVLHRIRRTTIWSFLRLFDNAVCGGLNCAPFLIADMKYLTLVEK